jgi:UPF0176 protein
MGQPRVGTFTKKWTFYSLHVRTWHMAHIAAFYCFHGLAVDHLPQLKSELEAFAQEHQVYGLVIVGKEGINSTVASTRDRLERFLAAVQNRFGREITPKWSEADEIPFRRFKVKVRPEIVTIGDENLVPMEPKDEWYLDPKEWDRVMKEDPNAVVLDTRNWYETKVGKFRNAIDPHLEEFREFGEYLEKADLAKDKKYLIYCTGGIRCEKAILEMHKQGFNEVYQLRGGILKYLEERPNEEFEGECFVFDHRVAVDQNLQPSKQYRFCPHCGQPAAKLITCRYCGDESKVCEHCLDSAPHLETCSKNCAHHYRQGHKFRRHHAYKHRPSPPTPNPIEAQPANPLERRQQSPRNNS